MKSKLRLTLHSVLQGDRVIEVWYGGEFIAQITGADGPGVRIITKHKLVTTSRESDLTVLEVQVAR